MKIKKILKVLLYTVLSIVAFVALYLGAAFLLARIEVKAEAGVTKEITIFILSNGVHTDLVVPVKNEIKDWSSVVKYSNTTGKDTTLDYLAIGWGDKGFYLDTPTWADLTFSTAFKAVFGLNSTAIHATFHKKLIENKLCTKLIISKEQYKKLIKYIDKSFRKSATDEYIFIPTNAVTGRDDSYYEAVGSYNLFGTCNTWANNGLKACGQKACLWTPFDTGILYQYGK